VEERRWTSDEYTRARTDGAEIERLMRSILKLFADGCLVYRDRTGTASSVETKSDRLKRVRRAMETTLEPGLPGAVA
jgi:hypothetical protein